MCLLIALSRVIPDVPLLVAANRDERYDRPAEAITVLRGGGPGGGGPRILGGRDQVAGGTWLAVSSRGVVAGLTNQPAGDRDPSRRSRGELPLAFTAYPDAATAVAALCPRLRPADYNPCWLLVGDRHALFSIDLTGGDRAVPQELGPGRYVLENVPLSGQSAKQQRIAALVSERAGVPGQEADGLAAVLRDHQPAGGPRPGPGGRTWPAELSAACVHTPGYGTRSAMIVSVTASGWPGIRVASGAPCVTPLQDVTGLWRPPAAAWAAGPETAGGSAADQGIREDC